MKIGFLLLSEGFSGAENALYNLLENMNKEDLFLFVNDRLSENYSDLKHVNIIKVGAYFDKSIFIKPFYFLKLLNKSKKVIKEINLNVLILFLSHSLVVYYLLDKKLKTIVSLRGEEIYNFINKFKPHNRFFMRNALKYSNRILSVSNKQINNLKEEYKKKTGVISNGVDSKKFKPLTNIKQKKDVILFVGRIKKEKGIIEIINVAKQLPQYKFWFAGQGELANLINLPNTKNLGFKTTEELVKLYNQATICILPSYHEGFSNVGLETISCGRALICTPDFSEYIENGKDGIIIPSKDENALKNAIVDLMTNKKKRKMLEKNARKKALKYSWDKIAEQYLKVFKEVVKK